MDMGLLVPEKQGGQYCFDAGCRKDLEDILHFKDMGFSLSEIKRIFLYKSFSKLAPYQEDLYYRTFFTEKLKKVERDISYLSEVREKIVRKLEELSGNKETNRNISGIDINALKLFRCLKCSGSLVLCEASVNSNQIICGKLKCSCGEEYKIDSGILTAGKPYLEQNDWADDNYIAEYMDSTDTAYLDELYRKLEWSRRKIELLDLEGKVILELGTGWGFFLRYIYDALPDDCIYIAVDHDLEKHRFLKSLIENTAVRKNIIFICSDFLSIPIKEKSVDVVADFSGTSNYSFKHVDFLPQLVDGYVKEEAVLFGSYILFRNFRANSLIDRKFRENFTLESIKEKIRGLGYETMEEKTSDYLEKGGKYEDYFVEGEKVYIYSVISKR